MIRLNQTQKKTEKAQGIVEFALILPILVLVLIGIMESGRLLFYYSSITSASREGARYGSAVGEVSNVSRYEDCDGIRAAALKAGSFAGIQNDNITIQYDDGTTVKDASCPPTTRIDLADRVVVTIAGNFKPVVPLLDVFFPEDGLNITSTTARTIIKQVSIKGTPRPTDTPLPGPESIPTDTPTFTPTNTPTDTPTATPTGSATPTNTSTPTATSTRTPTPTTTPSPTNTPTPTLDPNCDVTVSLYSVGDYKASWEIVNIGNRDLRLYQIGAQFPYFPNEFGNLLGVAFGNPIWVGSLSSPAEINDWNQGEQFYRDLAVGNTKLLVFTFEKRGKGYEPHQLDVFFHNIDGQACTVSKTW